MKMKKSVTETIRICMSMISSFREIHYDGSDSKATDGKTVTVPAPLVKIKHLVVSS